MSVDLANGTLFKSRHQARRVGNEVVAAEWPRQLSRIFIRFVREFESRVSERRRNANQVDVHRPRLWKINGDELLFHELVYPDAAGLTNLACTVAGFLETVGDLDRELLPDGLGLHGAVWTAGFPIRNKVLKSPRTHDVTLVTVNDRSAGRDFDAGIDFRDDDGVVDYIGPDMDLGFRLGAITPVGRVSASLDVVWLLTFASAAVLPRIYHVGWRTLKGIAEGAPYPVFWVDTAPTPRARHAWDPHDASPETHRFLTFDVKDALTVDDVQLLARQVWNDLPHFFIQPYVMPDRLPEHHRVIWKQAPIDDLGPIIIDPHGVTDDD